MDVAKRQLRTATLLWFMDEDPVSIHTIISAAHEITHTLFRKKGLRGLLFDMPLPKEEFRAEVAKALKAAANFFKHAQKDLDASIEFNPGMNRVLIITVASGLRRMGEQLDDIQDAFLAWTAIHHPELIGDSLAQDLGTIENLHVLREIDKGQFLQHFRDFRNRIKIGMTSGA
jgi:hypothetical protein